TRFSRDWSSDVCSSDLVITGRRETVLQEAAKELDAHYYVNDITEKHLLPDLVERIESEIGPIDILVNNAGINLKKPVWEVTDEDFETILQTNLNAVFALTRECGRRMKDRKSVV